MARLLFSLGLTDPKRRARGRLSIATFHRVLPEHHLRAYPYPGLAVTPEELDVFLAYFTRHFDCGPLAIQHERHSNGEVPARPLLAITFDDAQYDNFLYARPVLDRHRVKASFFAPVIAVERQELLWHDRLGFAALALINDVQGGRAELDRILRDSAVTLNDSSRRISDIAEAAKGLTLEARLRLIDHLVESAGSPVIPEFARVMNAGEISDLADDGHEIGSHSMTHCLMPECDDQALEYEIADSRQMLQQLTGQPIDTFCYPNGNTDARVAAMVAKSGYRRAITTRWGSNGINADRFQLCRFDMDAERVIDQDGKFLPCLLAFRMSGLYPGLF